MFFSLEKSDMKTLQYTVVLKCFDSTNENKHGGEFGYTFQRISNTICWLLSATDFGVKETERIEYIYTCEKLISFYCMHCTLSSVHSRQKSIVMLLYYCCSYWEAWGVNIRNGAISKTARMDLEMFSFDDFVHCEWDYERLAELFARGVDKRRRISVLKS